MCFFLWFRFSSSSSSSSSSSIQVMLFGAEKRKLKGLGEGITAEGMGGILSFRTALTLKTFQFI